jgi:hypothetical protein
MHPLVEETVKKAAVAWIGFGDGPAYCVWVLPLEGRLYVIAGPGEQSLPGLSEALQTGSPATISLRGDHGGSIVAFTADMTEVRPDTTEWESVTPQLATKRLNASGTAEDLIERWATTGCVLLELTAGESGVSTDLAGTSTAQPPRPGAAVRETRKPFRLHRVKKR